MPKSPGSTSPVTVLTNAIVTEPPGSHLVDAASAEARAPLVYVASTLRLCTWRALFQQPAPWPCIAPWSVRWHAHHALPKNIVLRPEHFRDAAESGRGKECRRNCRREGRPT